MCSCRAIIIVTSLLVEWELPVYIAVYRVAAVSSVKRLRVVCPQTEIVDILCETVDIIILLIETVSLERSTLLRKGQES